VIDPTDTNGFISPPLSITVAAGQKVFVTANCGLGSFSVGGAANLRLYIGFLATGATGPTNLGGGVFGISAPANSRQMYGLSGVLTGLAPGTYQVGLTGSSTDFANWNNNEFGYVSALVF
jgi:hypothetical protein